MVGDDSYGMLGSLQVLAPFLKCKDDCQKLSVIDVVVLLSGGEGSRKVGAGVKILVSVGLKENGSSCKERCIGHDGKRLGYIRDLKYRGRGEDSF